ANTFVDFGTLITAAINFVIIAAVVYFVIVLPFEKIKALSAKKGDDAAALTEAELLTEIRDLLASQQDGGRTSSGTGAPSATATDGSGRHEA
ncbi:MAG: MscL family protein, partial [Williamsia herbipolensis]|nr:MscL family protein [Williamsia herbipolensis]